MSGDYKTAREASKEFASLAVCNFDLALKTYNPVNGSIPVFSKIGWNCFKFMICEKFRRFSPEERLLAKMVKDWKKEQNIKQYMA